MALIFPGKNTGVGCHVLLQGIFPTKGLNLSLPALAGRFFASPNLVHPKFFSYFLWDVAAPSPYTPVTHTPPPVLSFFVSLSSVHLARSIWLLMQEPPSLPHADLINL